MSNSNNVIDQLAAQWEARKEGLVKLYGPQVLSDKEFIKATRDTYNSILRSTRYSKLSFDEKISYRIMRGQQRHLNQVLYPNRLVRAARNIIVAAFRLVRGIGRIIGGILNNWLAIGTGTNGLQIGRKGRRQPNRALLSPRLQTAQAQRPTTTPSHTAAQTKNATQQQKVGQVVPRRFNNARVVSINNPTKGQRI